MISRSSLPSTVATRRPLRNARARRDHRLPGKIQSPPEPCTTFFLPPADEREPRERIWPRSDHEDRHRGASRLPSNRARLRLRRPRDLSVARSLAATAFSQSKAQYRTFCSCDPMRCTRRKATRCSQSRLRTYFWKEEHINTGKSDYKFYQIFVPRFIAFYCEEFS